MQDHYVRLFEHSPELTRGGANMVFAGEADDPGTLQALARHGLQRARRPSSPACAAGITAATRQCARPRARELLTEVQPLLIEALAKTADPDLAFVGFDRFLSELPSGVQLFSLLKQNRGLLELIAAIMGTAPRLARILSKRRRVLDAVLAPGFFGSLPSAARSRSHRRRRAGRCRRLPGSAGSRAPHRPRAGLPDRRARADRHHQRRPGGRRLRAARRDADRRPCRPRSSARWSARTAACRAAPPSSSPWASSAAAR